MSVDIKKFVQESNMIEGIIRPPTDREVLATEEFISADSVSVVRLKALVAVLQPNAVLRTRPHLNVRVGNHIPPPGGPHIERRLEGVLETINDMLESPYSCHCDYETLHPFTDGNGRSGRALWLWQMLRSGNDAQLGFLHTWYYQSLSDGR